ncbi:MAG: hypothetical protein IJJ71_00375 [Treponema sp.]|uniref:hypothetical protein n=1 Tax=Treponema sp. TaxID=166 RepID=UPI0025CE6A7C|nr:hypothetical protein [Treponema sp.]MBR0494614.1 hypothetical protein [Treponema sp.]
MSNFANSWISTKSSSQREHGTGIHGCAKLKIRLATLARTKWIRAITPLTLDFAQSANAKLDILPFYVKMVLEWRVLYLSDMPKNGRNRGF